MTFPSPFEAGPVADELPGSRPEWAAGRQNAAPAEAEWPQPAPQAAPPTPRRVRPRIPRGARGAAGVALALVAGFAGGKLAGGDPAASRAQATARPSVSASAPSVSAADLSALYVAISPSVVQVVSSGAGRGDNGAGSGVIIDTAGTILTNNHVALSEDVRVVHADGRRLDATVVGREPQMDLAVVRLNDAPEGLVPARLGDSSKVVPGQEVFAIGAPFGLQGSLTSGVVSAINRTFEGEGGESLRGLIQTDAAINPGNSGGPLFNAAGEVVGITTAIESPVRGFVGVGFAVPINQAQAALPTLVRA